MSLPFLVSCSMPEPLLFECSDGRFQLVDQMPLSPFMSGYGYLLVEKKLAAFLKQVKVERVSFSPAIVFSAATGEEFTTHVRIRVSQFFRGNELLDLDASGYHMLTLSDQYYFVSQELKAALQSSEFRYRQFSEGLSGFAAVAAYPLIQRDALRRP